MFPEKLYLLTQKDLAGSLIIPYFNNASGAALDTVVNATITNDNGDRFIVLTAASMTAVSGAAQTTLNVTMSALTPVTDSTPVEFSFSAVPVPLAAGVALRQALSWSGKILIPPMWRVRAAATYSAAANSNSTFLQLFGVLIPRGSIQRL